MRRKVQVRALVISGLRRARSRKPAGVPLLRLRPPNRSSCARPAFPGTSRPKETRHAVSDRCDPTPSQGPTTGSSACFVAGGIGCPIRTGYFLVFPAGPMLRSRLPRRHALGDPPAHLHLRAPQLPSLLKIQPQFWARTEVPGQPQSRVRVDSGAFLENRGQQIRRQVQYAGQGFLGHSRRVRYPPGEPRPDAPASCRS